MVENARRCRGAVARPLGRPATPRAPVLGMLAVVFLQRGPDDVLEQRDLVDAVPYVLEDEEVAVVDLRPPVEDRAGREQLQELDHAPVADAHALGADLEDETLVAR